MSTAPKPSFRASLGKAWRLYRGHFGQALMFVLCQIVIRLMALTPCLFLLMKGCEAWALLTVPLFILLVIPARRNAAAVCRQFLSGGDLFSPELLFGRQGYLWALMSGLRTAVFVLIWALPLIGVSVFLYVRYLGSAGVQGDNDVFTLANRLAELGGGNLGRGLITAAGALAGLVLLLVAGLAFHSGARHDWAHGGCKIRGARARGGVLGSWLLGMLLFLPFAIVLLLVGWDFLRTLLGGVLFSLSANMGHETKTLSQEAQNQLTEAVQSAGTAAGGWHVWTAVGAFVLLVLPLIPLKTLFTAAWVDSLWENRR